MIVVKRCTFLAHLMRCEIPIRMIFTHKFGVAEFGYDLSFLKQAVTVINSSPNSETPQFSTASSTADYS
jgi:hypothetical protein